MGRFYRPAVYDRRGPAVQAQGDGKDTDGVYAGTIMALPDSSGNAKVLIPGLSVQHYEPCKCKLTVTVGESVLVMFDDNKHGWVIA